MLNSEAGYYTWIWWNFCKQSHIKINKTKTKKQHQQQQKKTWKQNQSFLRKQILSTDLEGLILSCSSETTGSESTFESTMKVETTVRVVNTDAIAAAWSTP